MIRASQVVVVAKNPPASAEDVKDVRGFDPWIGKIPRRRAWLPTPVFLHGESQGQRSLADRTEAHLAHTQERGD